MALWNRTRLLRYSLTGNGLFSLLSGSACILLSGDLASLIFAFDNSLARLAAPALLVEMGVALVLFSLLLFWLASSRRINRAWAMIVSILDGAWVIGSAALLVFAGGMFSAEGVGTVSAVAGIVALFAIGQVLGLAQPAGALPRGAKTRLLRAA